MTRLEELERILEAGCGGNCEYCKAKGECEELENLHRKENATIFKSGEVYENEDTSIFIKHVGNGVVAFIEGCSPSAIHDMQEIPEENLLEHINNYGFKKTA